MKALDQLLVPGRMLALLPAIPILAALIASPASAAIEGDWEVSGTSTTVYSTLVDGATVLAPGVSVPFDDELTFYEDGFFSSSLGSGPWVRSDDGTYAIALDGPSVKDAFTKLLGGLLPGLTGLSVTEATATATMPGEDDLAGVVAIALKVTTEEKGTRVKGNLAWTTDFKSSHPIKGLSFADFSVTWDNWDEDPAFDGISVGIEYFTPDGDFIHFSRKPHRVRLEFFTQKPDASGSYLTFDELIFSHEVTIRDTEAPILVAKELYEQALLDAGYNLTRRCEVFVVVTVHPPLGQPQSELVIGYPYQTVWRPEWTGLAPKR